ncbi:hypothetical protein GWK47_017585 [Chionoecetes opilio]|uniref:Uncharacterized protein n=1 Tax=Chionoecetes opilio TaxID=41210 RepID=A0A8J4XR64_CHIOP|nr:hypothetical protein GWK47_017585 [Chionoecetes opilio]
MVVCKSDLSTRTPCQTSSRKYQGVPCDKSLFGNRKSPCIISRSFLSDFISMRCSLLCATLRTTFVSGGKLRCSGVMDMFLGSYCTSANRAALVLLLMAFLSADQH